MTPQGSLHEAGPSQEAVRELALPIERQIPLAEPPHEGWNCDRCGLERVSLRVALVSWRDQESLRNSSMQRCKSCPVRLWTSLPSRYRVAPGLPSMLRVEDRKPTDVALRATVDAWAHSTALAIHSSRRPPRLVSLGLSPAILCQNLTWARDGCSVLEAPQDPLPAR
jgi:hypothetical protein